MPQNKPKAKKKTADKYPEYSDRTITNTGQADRMRAYLSKSKGAKVTQPVAGKATGDKARGARQANAYGLAQRRAQGRPDNDVAPAVRKGNGMRPAGIVRNPSQSMYGGGGGTTNYSGAQGFTGAGANYGNTTAQGPQPQPQGFGPQPQQRIQTEQPPASAYQMPPRRPSMFGPSTSPIFPQYNQAPMAQTYQPPQGPPPGYQPPPQNMGQQGRYMPPRPMSTMGDMGGLHPLSTNPWSRQW